MNETGLNIDYEKHIRKLLRKKEGFDSDLDIIRWMHTSKKEWSDLSPSTLIGLGKGEQVLQVVEGMQ